MNTYPSSPTLAGPLARLNHSTDPSASESQDPRVAAHRLTLIVVGHYARELQALAEEDEAIRSEFAVRTEALGIKKDATIAQMNSDLEAAITSWPG